MILPQWDLSRKVALVTGGGSALGRAAALALAHAGADVAVACRSSANAEATAEAVRQAGRRSTATVADTSDPAAAARIVKDTVDAFGRIDILVNAQESAFAKPVSEISPEEWRKILDSNLSSAFFSCQAAIPQMLSQGKGKIINLVSGMAERGIAQSSTYAASKAGLIALTRSLAIELVRQGINVNAVGVGWFEGQGFDTTPLHRFIPMRRPGKPDEIGGVVHYLAAPASDIVTGEIIYVEGGVLAHG